MSISRDEVVDLLSPWYWAFRRSVVDGFHKYFEVHQDELQTIHERTKSSYVNDQIVENLRQNIPGASNIAWEERYGQRRLWIDGKVCIRVKKLNKNLQPTNIPTQASFDFYNQLLEVPAQLRFPNMEPPTGLFLGYTVNQTRTAVQHVYIICTKNEETVDWIVLVPEAGGFAPLAKPMETPSSEKQPGRVTAKGNLSKKLG